MPIYIGRSFAPTTSYDNITASMVGIGRYCKNINLLDVPYNPMLNSGAIMSAGLILNKIEPR